MIFDKQTLAAGRPEAIWELTQIKDGAKFENFSAFSPAERSVVAAAAYSLIMDEHTEMGAALKERIRIVGLYDRGRYKDQLSAQDLRSEYLHLATFFPEDSVMVARDAVDELPERFPLRNVVSLVSSMPRTDACVSALIIPRASRCSESSEQTLPINLRYFCEPIDGDTDEYAAGVKNAIREIGGNVISDAYKRSTRTRPNISELLEYLEPFSTYYG